MSNILKALRRAFRSFESERTEVTDGATEASWRLRVTVSPDELDGGWIANRVDLPGCVSQGDTGQEALENLSDAIGGVIATRLDRQFRSVPPHGNHGAHEIAISV